MDSPCIKQTVCKVLKIFQCGKYLVAYVLKGFQRLNPTKDSRAPVTLQMLKGFPLALKYVTVSKYEALLFSTAFSIAFFGFLRIGEMIACGKSSDNSHLIHNTDVAIYEQNVEITLRFSKTDQLGKSAKLLFYPSQEAHICPVSLTKQFLKVRPKVQGPLFCHLMDSLLRVTSFHPFLTRS